MTSFKASFSGNRLILVSIALLSMVTWIIVRPFVLAAVPIAIGLSWLVFLFVTKSFSLPCLFEQFTALSIITGCSLELIALFPERLAMIILMAVLTGFWAEYFLFRQKPALAWLTVTLGLSTAPLTELHLDRNLWVLTACLAGTLYMVNNRALPIFEKRRLKWASMAWVLITCITLAGTLWSVYPYYAHRFTGILIINFFIFLQIVSIASSNDQRRLLLKTLLSFAGVYVLAAGTAFMERVLGLGWLNATGFRIYVFERHPNYAIFFLLHTLPFWLLYVKDSRPKERAFLLTGFISSLLYLLLLSFSRQGYIVLAVYLIAFLLFGSKTIIRKYIYRAALISAGFSVIVFLLSDSLKNRIKSIFDLTNSLRFNAWRVFWDLIIEKPFQGYGMGSARYIYPKALSYFRPGEPATRQFLFEAHNAYIDILVSLGCIGLIIFLFFLGICTFAKSRKEDFESQIAFVLGIAVWIDLFFNFRIHAPDTSTYLMVFLGFIIAVHAKHDKPFITKQIMVKPWLSFLLLIPLFLFCSLPWLGKHFVSKGQKLLSGNDWTKITRCFQNAAYLEPLNAHPQYYLALCYENINDIDQAINHHKRAVDLCPNYPFYRYFLAVALMERNQVDEAENHLMTAAALEPYDEDARVRFNLGILRWRRGEYLDAKQDFWTSILLNPKLIDDPYWEYNKDLKTNLIRDLYNYLGGFLSLGATTEHNLKHLIPAVEAVLRSGDKNFALRCLLTTAMNYPFFPEIVNQAVYMLIDNGRADIAKDVIYHSLANNETNPYLYNYLGLIYLLEKNFDMATFCVRRSFAQWEGIAIDNFLGYQLLVEIGRQTNNQMLLSNVLPSVAYLENGRYARQAADLSVHIGTDSYQVKPIGLKKP
ncbi:MAG: O-antigen ligase family protein [bacterium]